jgi:hypothetical protein
LSSATQTDRRFPFGAPDGTPRDGIDDPLKDFVRVGGSQFSLGLGMPENDRKARVIVGRKGAGKTLYLRRLQRAASKDSSLYADAWQTAHPPTSEVIRVYDLARDAGHAVEMWEMIWSGAVYRSVASHLLCAPRLRPVTERVADELREELAALGCKAMRRISPPAHQVQEILYEQRTLQSLERYLSHPAWHRVELIVQEVLGDAPPVCLYLDALDEHFERAPKQWLACQLGLCRLVLFLAEEFPRIHVVITIRDLVYSALQASEHRMRYKRMERIRTLDWNCPAIDRLLRSKISNLPEELFVGHADAGSDVERWLGLKEIANAGASPDRAGNAEDAKEYLLRHTRLIPRDLVQLGNALCHAIDEARDDGVDFLSHDAIHRAVSGVARDAGIEELLVVANHITTTWMPPRSAEMGIVESFTPGDQPDHKERTLQEYVRDRLSALIRAVKVDRVPRKQFQQFLGEARDAFGDKVDIASLLWQHGLVGYIDGPRKAGKPVFYSAIDKNDMTLADDHSAYAFHPIMIDAIPLTGIGEVVRAF